MRKALETLNDLQEIDFELKKLEKVKGDLPQKVESLNEEVKQLVESIKSKRQALEENEKAKRNAENEVALLKERLAKYRKQLYQVHTNREYDAITSEIETTEKSLDQKEFELLEREEDENNLQEEIVNAEETLGQQTQVLKEMKIELEKRLAVTNNTQVKLSSQRKNVTNRLSPQLLSNYERILSGRNGVALAHLVDGACSECSSRIPPQRAMEIRQMNRIYICEVCGRILVWRPEAEEVCSVS